MPAIGVARRTLLGLVLAGALLGAAGSVFAGSVSPGVGVATRLALSAKAKARAQAGLLSASCSGCHVVGERLGGAPTDGIAIPSLAHLSRADLKARLLAYRDGSLQGTVMNRIAKGYTDKEIRILARTLGVRKPWARRWRD